jgi:hypothetical protein
MNVKAKFLELTSKTYPHGTESEMFHMLGKGLEKDKHGNLFIKIGDSDVMFTSHLDTATSQNTKVNHVVEKDIIKTDGKSILGADDKAGVVVMLYMIEKLVPGLYYFFLGEEVGCVGSGKLAREMETNKIEGINKVVSFDRRGTNSVISHQSYQRCASDEFVKELAKMLNEADSSFKYAPDDTGVLTDSFEFIGIYPECTNISVGYYSEHTHQERQDIKHLEKLAIACTKIDWASLPVARDVKKVEYMDDYIWHNNNWKSSRKGNKRKSKYDTKNHRISKKYNSNDWDCGWDWDYDDWDGSEKYNYGSSISRNNGTWDYDERYDGMYNEIDDDAFYHSSAKSYRPETLWFYDKRYNHISYVEAIKSIKKYVKVDLCKERLEDEMKLIRKLLIDFNIDFIDIDWDGMDLKIEYPKYDDVGNITRNDIVEYIPEIDYFFNKESLGYISDVKIDDDFWENTQIEDSGLIF